MSKRILIIRLSALGDVIFTLPVLQAIRKKHPGAKLTWLVEDRAATLLLHRRDLDQVLVYPRKAIGERLYHPLRWGSLAGILARHLRALRKEHFDLVLDFQGNLKSGIHVLLARGGIKRGYAREYVKEKNHLFTNEHVTPPARALHRIEKSLSLVDPDFKPEEIEPPDLYIPEDLAKEAEESLARLGMVLKSFMVVHPGTSAFGAFKRWAPDRFGRLARRLHHERGLSTLVAWGPGEHGLAEAVAQAGGESVKVAPPTRSLMHLAAFIRFGRVYVSADSGPLHLANYLGVPCLALFGPKDPALYRPYFLPSRVSHARNVACAPCPKRDCRNPICMEKLEVGEVYEELCRLLDETWGTPQSLNDGGDP